MYLTVATKSGYVLKLYFILIFALEKLENLLTSLCMKLVTVQEGRFELLPVGVLAIKGGQ